jgi:hypothetical protein
MSTSAQLTANQANADEDEMVGPYPRNSDPGRSAPGQGPRTAPGKHRSSRKAVTLGLFTLRDFVRPDERDDYARLGSSLRHELNPRGTLEETFAAAIIGAVWRLHRCSLVEAKIAETADLDPMEDQATSCLQVAIDRARAHAHNLMRRSLAELRRLQTDRTIREELFDGALTQPEPDLTSYKEVAIAINHGNRCKLLARKLDGIDSIAALMAPPPTGPAELLASFCKTPATPAAGTPPVSPSGVPAPVSPSGVPARNSPCPCGSGVKHKRCCGRNAPPVLQQAA